MKKFKDFIRDKRGAVFILVGLTFVSMTGLVASAMDYSRGSLLRAELSAALDSAALAGGTVANSASMNAMVNKYFNVNMPSNYMGSTVNPVTISQAADKSTLTVSATAQLKNGMMQVVNWNLTNVAASSEVTVERKGMELVLVLDNTGSMSNKDGTSTSRMDALKAAATDLVNILYGSKTTTDTFWIGLVPFSQAVNIGTSRSSWTTGVTQSSSMDWGTGNAWKGCVEARHASGRDMTDDPPSVALFPPYYSSCVSWSSSSKWLNGWYGTTTSSLGGTNTPSLTLKTGCNGSYGSRTYTNPLDTIITNVNGSTTSYYNYGPNQYCPQPVTPMTSDKATIIAGINSMKAIGDTQINTGLVWGWRMLSPRWRSKADGTSWWGGEMAGDATADPPKPALPMDYNQPLRNKVIILLSDGDNSYLPNNYAAYGQLTAGNTGSSCSINGSGSTDCSYNAPSAEKKLDDKAKSICDTLKASDKNILIYTIALGGTISSTGKSLMQYCASKPEYYFESPTGNDLSEAFHTIGDSLSNLRISK